MCDGRAGGSGLGILQNAGQRTPPVRVETDVRIGEHEEIAGGAQSSQISRACDTQGLRMDDAAWAGQVGDAPAGAVVHYDQLATRGQRGLEVLHGAAKFRALVAGDYYDA